MKFWLWPNRVIGKRRSGELREDHNKAIQQIYDLRNAGKDIIAASNANDSESLANAMQSLVAVIEATKPETWEET